MASEVKTENLQHAGLLHCYVLSGPGEPDIANKWFRKNAVLQR